MLAGNLYFYDHPESVNGVIAFDQQFLADILRVTGTIELDGDPFPINFGNINAVMRSTKIPPVEERTLPDYERKALISKICNALMEKLFSGDIRPERLFTLFLKALNEHHLLLQVDSPSITSLLARHRWDGAVRPEQGDFLMVVDTNVGANKTNAVVKSSLSYDVDLTKPAAPIGSLTVVHKNNAARVIVIGRI